MTLAAPHSSSRGTWRAAAIRTVGFAVVWAVLYGSDVAAFPVGLAAAVAASWASLRLISPGTFRLSPGRLFVLGYRFGLQSVVAGADVARRALDPRMPLSLGFVRYRPRLARGPALNAFCAWTSLLPGTLCCEIGDDGSVLLHCLDTNQPVLAQMSAEETRFIAALGDGRCD